VFDMPLLYGLALGSWSGSLPWTRRR